MEMFWIIESVLQLSPYFLLVLRWTVFSLDLTVFRFWFVLDNRLWTNLLKNVALRNNNTHSHHIEYNIDIGIKYRIPQNTARSSETDSIGNFFMLLLILFDLTQFFSSNNCQTFVIKLQIIGAVCLGLILSKYDHYAGFSLYFLLMVTTFLIGTFCLLISCLFSLSTGGIISKTIYVKAEYFLNLIKFSWKLKRIDWLPFLNGFLFSILGAHLPYGCCHSSFDCISLFAR